MLVMNRRLITCLLENLPVIKPKERDAFACPDYEDANGSHVPKDLNKLSSVSTQ